MEVQEAHRVADLRAQARRLGRVLNLVDVLIAGTALVHGLGIATRSTADFAGHGITLIDPWQVP